MSRKISDLQLSPLDILIVGGTGGLGRAIGRTLASCGAHVTVVGQTFRDEGVSNISFIQADLSSIENSKQVASSLDVSKTDVVLFTTGIIAASKREETNEGLEKDLAVSYLNRLAMLNIIVPKLKSVPNSLGFTPRVFLMGFPGNNQLGDKLDDLNQEKSYGVISAHMNTVAGNEALIVENQDRYPNVKFFGLNPGIVKTNIRSNLLGTGYFGSILEWVLSWFTYTPEQYASNVTPLIVAPELEKYNGSVFNNKAKEIPVSKGMTEEHAHKFVQASIDLLKSKGINV